MKKLMIFLVLCLPVFAGVYLAPNDASQPKVVMFLCIVLIYALHSFMRLLYPTDELYWAKNEAIFGMLYLVILFLACFAILVAGFYSLSDWIPAIMIIMFLRIILHLWGIERYPLILLAVEILGISILLYFVNPLMVFCVMPIYILAFVKGIIYVKARKYIIDKYWRSPFYKRKAS